MRRKTRALTIWSSPEQIAYLDKLANEYAITRAAMARRLLSAGLKAMLAARAKGSDQ